MLHVPATYVESDILKLIFINPRICRSVFLVFYPGKKGAHGSKSQHSNSYCCDYSAEGFNHEIKILSIAGLRAR